MPIVLAPVGLTGMYARRGEVKAARAAVAKGIPFTLSSVSVCSIAEVQAAVGNAFWFQLYVLKDRGFMRDVLERSWAAGVRTLVFTVDMPVPGARYRDAHSGMSGPYALSCAVCYRLLSILTGLGMLVLWGVHMILEMFLLIFKKKLN
ncbi:L-lactate dehydrogenase [cytochrome] [Bartonella melophagi K-2C]|uniref:L-lactate dehydrogenase [cytochrome] n=1 Tax=Bartonella melophagi K-2C TaxID=1094557 RepID=J0ZSR1_9HYPH|nr:L-lactate dehydrogenase [cytochrome] [Bartonella melophagi K-2C]